MTGLQSPRLRLFIGAALISLSPVWVKLVEVSPTTSGFYRVLIGGMALAVYMLARRQRLQLSRNVWLMIIVAAVFLTLDLWFWHRSIIYIGPGLATLLANFQVFFMMLAGIALLRQMPSPIQLVAVPMALLGLADAGGHSSRRALPPPAFAPAGGLPPSPWRHGVLRARRRGMGEEAAETKSFAVQGMHCAS